MITIVSQPADFTPIESGVVYVVESDYSGDFLIKIINNTTGEVVGSKAVVASTRAAVDIAPYITAITAAEPAQQGVFSLAPAPAEEYYIEVTTDEESEVSEVVRVSNNRRVPKVGSVQSIFGLSRKISYGEDDELRFTAANNSTIVARITTDRGEVVELECYAPYGVAVLHIATAQLDYRTSRFEVEFYADDVLMQSVEYAVVPRYEGAVRVAWLSEEGTVERHTFRQTLSKSVATQRDTLFTNRQGEHIVRCRSAKRIALRSHPLTEAEADALATILSAPKVWIESLQMAVARPLDVEAVTYSFGKLARVDLTLEYGEEEVVL